MIKKLENFWKALSNDRTQISAVPPVQYGERFFNFISATTMSPEEVAREAQEREAAEAAAAVPVPTSSSPQEQKRVTSWGSGRWRAAAGQSGSAAGSSQQPAMPAGAQSPPLPSGRKSPEEEETIQRAESVAERMDKHGKSERDVPERILKTTSMPASVAMPPLAGAVKQQSASTATGDMRESTLGNQGPILPIVEEVGEASSVGSSERREVSNGNDTADGKIKVNGSNRSSQSGSDDDSDYRPLTPAKDGAEVGAGFGNPVMGSSTSPRGKPPPTPPKTGYGSPKSNSRASHLKADSADSGYGATGGGVGSVSGSQRSQNSTLGSGRAGKIRSQISRESLDKALPALPKITQRIDEDGDHVTRIGIS
jgi:1-phosphatidylinositol-4-phosphate 5-kinase